MSAEKVVEAILILDGEIDTQFLDSQLTHCATDLLICTDGAYLHLKSLVEIHNKLDVVIGDFDSIGQQQITDERIKVIHDPDQDTTDFDKALAYLYANGVSKVIIYGASGLSSDHFLGNLSTALYWKEKLKLEFRDHYGIYFFIDSNIHLKGIKGQKVSVIPFFEVKNIYYEGLKYPLNGESLTFGKRIGTRNLAISDTVIIRYDSGNVLIYIENKHYVKERL
ncbi:thiamine diphosphokinase [Thiotrichales bacterium 19S3-7]|nr:thiamine diphosphokinase [Thiotrichales bacterium 19S3-7]MCF6801334.1 thiamine diphosphokinase [Thiotrichales bacterium 19S3-11]